MTPVPPLTCSSSAAAKRTSWYWNMNLLCGFLNFSATCDLSFSVYLKSLFGKEGQLRQTIQHRFLHQSKPAELQCITSVLPSVSKLHFKCPSFSCLLPSLPLFNTSCPFLQLQPLQETYFFLFMSIIHIINHESETGRNKNIAVYCIIYIQHYNAIYSISYIL